MKLEIRVRNASTLDFDSVLVVFPDGERADYGRIPRGASSGFRSVARAYRYAEFAVKAEGREYALQPIDYVGERQLVAGRHTYVLGVSSGRLTCDLEAPG